MTRFRQRQAREDGFIAVAAMGIMLLLIGTSLMVLGAAKVHIITAREGRNFTESRQGMEEAFADAIYNFNTYSLTKTSGTGPRVNGRGTWSWTYNAATREVTATGTVNGTEQSMTRPVRARYVGSYANSGDTTVYGIASNGATANGTWSSLVSAARDSTIAGALAGTPDIALYGAAALTRSGTSPLRVTSYSDGASFSPSLSGDVFQRSALTAQMDQNLLIDRTNATANCPAYTDSAWTGGASACLIATGAITPPAATWTGVRTLIVKGNLTLTNDISLTGTAQLHLYVTGNVTFAKSPAPGIETLANVFIFAPNGTCTANDPALKVAFTGAMACDTVTLPNTANTFNYSAPRPDPAYPGSASKIVYYTETAGYADSLTP